MTAGTAVPLARAYAVTQLQAAAGLSGVRVQYSPITNLDQALADNGRVEVVFWAESASVVSLRAFKGTAHVKYREEATATLVVIVAAATVADDLSVVELRAADLIGEIVKVVQTSMPPSPGAWLQSITWHVSGWRSSPGRISSAGTVVHAVSYDVEISIEANVEQ